jgi:hypothetical protein
MEPPQPSARAAAGALFDQVFVILVHAHVGAVHDLDDFTVDVPGRRRLSSIFHRAVPGRVWVEQLALGLAPLVEGHFSHFQGDFVDVPVFDFTVDLNGDGHVPGWGDGQQLVGVFDFVASVSLRAADRKTSATQRPWSEWAAAPPAIMRMKLRAAMVLAVAPHRPFAGVFAFDAALGQGQAAGAHGAVFTADALDADGAGFHLGGPVEHRIDASSWARVIGLPKAAYCTKGSSGSWMGVHWPSL